MTNQMNQNPMTKMQMNQNPMTKMCGKCNENKSITEFDEWKTDKTQLRSWCHTCDLVAAKIRADAQAAVKRYCEQCNQLITAPHKTKAFKRCEMCRQQCRRWRNGNSRSAKLIGASDS